MENGLSGLIYWNTAPDLKSLGHCVRAGSIPAPGTTLSFFLDYICFAKLRFSCLTIICLHATMYPCLVYGLKYKIHSSIPTPPSALKVYINLKFSDFPYATIRNNVLMKEFCLGLSGLGQKLNKSLSSAAWVISFLTSEKAKWLRLLTA